MNRSTQRWTQIWKTQQWPEQTPYKCRDTDIWEATRDVTRILLQELKMPLLHGVSEWAKFMCETQTKNGSMTKGKPAFPDDQVNAFMPHSRGKTVVFSFLGIAAGSPVIVFWCHIFFHWLWTFIVFETCKIDNITLKCAFLLFLISCFHFCICHVITWLKNTEHFYLLNDSSS